MVKNEAKKIKAAAETRDDQRAADQADSVPSKNDRGPASTPAGSAL